MEKPCPSAGGQGFLMHIFLLNTYIKNLLIDDFRKDQDNAAAVNLPAPLFSNITIMLIGLPFLPGDEDCIIFI
jgi:hypothetical protein